MVYASRDGFFFAMEPCRRTLGDTDTFVIPQFWEARDHSVWWDLRYVHVWLTGSFSEQLKVASLFQGRSEVGGSRSLSPEPQQAAPMALQKDKPPSS